MSNVGGKVAAINRRVMKDWLLVHKKATLLGGILLGLIIITASVSQAHAIKNQLNDWKLLPQPEKLTELYFNNSSHLPSTYSPETPQGFSFTIHNLQYQDEVYSYVVTEQNNDSTQSQTLTQGTIHLSQNQTRLTPISITPTDLGPRAKITVQLLGFNQSIDYWVDK